MNTFLLQGERLPLHVFEPRYQQLFNEAEEDGLLFGLPFEVKEKGIRLVSICKLIETTKRYKSGKRDVVIETIKVGRLQRHDKTFSGKLYPGGMIEGDLEEVGRLGADITLIDLFADYIELRAGTRPAYAVVKNYKVNDIAISIGLTNEEKVKYLLKESDGERANYIEKRMTYLKFLLYQESRAENGILLN